MRNWTHSTPHRYTFSEFFSDLLGATVEDRARCSVDLDWVSRDVRDLVLNQNLQNKRSHFVLKSIAQSFNSCAVDDVLKLAADASVGAFNLNVGAETDLHAIFSEQMLL
jgi:hypothetical protein